ncbi:MAG: SDR family oxidoreductase [Solirubrobacterales bacterium]|nr:SDR family oxidoreductase [Solirubrobacterales bacterium]
MAETQRAALVTGGSSGIGLAIARALAEDGYGITLSARRPEKLTAAADAMRDDGFDVLDVPAQMTEEEELRSLVEAHADRFGRLDVLVNNAGVGIGEGIDQLTTKKVDMQLGVNLRAVMLMTRECLPMLKEAGAEHHKALIVNTASIAGKSPQPWLSVYSATKAAVLAWSQSNQKEIAGSGIQVTALAPGFVDTPMTEFVKDSVGAETMIRPEDLAEAVRYLLRTSPNCLVPEIVFMRPEEANGGGAP